MPSSFVSLTILLLTPVVYSAAIPVPAAQRIRARAPPNVPTVAQATTQLAALTVAAQGTQDGYSRDLFPRKYSIRPRVTCTDFRRLDHNLRNMRYARDRPAARRRRRSDQHSLCSNKWNMVLSLRRRIMDCSQRRRHRPHGATEQRMEVRCSFLDYCSTSSICQ